MPTRQEQIDLILDHYEHPRHRGPLVNADFVGSGTNPGCGDVLTMYLRLNGGQRIAEVSFEGQGCTISQAAASLLTDLIVGKTLAEVVALDGQIMADEIGHETVANRLACATLALNAVKSAIETQA